MIQIRQASLVAIITLGSYIQYCYWTDRKLLCQLVVSSEFLLAKLAPSSASTANSVLALSSDSYSSLKGSSVGEVGLPGSPLIAVAALDVL